MAILTNMPTEKDTRFNNLLRPEAHPPFLKGGVPIEASGRRINQYGTKRFLSRTSFGMTGLLELPGGVEIS
jgi:hypothetical protein